MAKRLLEHYSDYTIEKHILETPMSLNDAQQKMLQKACDRLNKDEPLQYVLGYTYFHGHLFTVTPHVLIPRPTTEEMVAFVLRWMQNKNIKVLDLCTGSGCIAISLAKSSSYIEVDAVDISEKALQIAKKNAKAHRVIIGFYKKDILQESLPNKKWHLIVSNPPYIPHKEKNTIALRVYNYEPHQALFVPDSNPLIFYKHIIKLAKTHLYPGGITCVEVHENFADEVSMLFQEAWFTSITVHCDLQRKKRWITAQKQIVMT